MVHVCSTTCDGLKQTPLRVIMFARVATCIKTALTDPARHTASLEQTWTSSLCGEGAALVVVRHDIGIYEELPGHIEDFELRRWRVEVYLKGSGRHISIARMILSGRDHPQHTIVETD